MCACVCGRSDARRVWAPPWVRARRGSCACVRDVRQRKRKAMRATAQRGAAERRGEMDEQARCGSELRHHPSRGAPRMAVLPALASRLPLPSRALAWPPLLSLSLARTRTRVYASPLFCLRLALCVLLASSAHLCAVRSAISSTTLFSPPPREVLRLCFDGGAWLLGHVPGVRASLQLVGALRSHRARVHAHACTACGTPSGRVGPPLPQPRSVY